MALALAKERLQDEIMALYVGGSYLRGDFIPCWSDIDITAIVKDEIWQNEALKQEFFKKHETISKEVENSIMKSLIITIIGRSKRIDLLGFEKNHLS